MGRQPYLVQPVGYGKGEVHQAPAGVCAVGGHLHPVIACDDLPGQLVFQLQHHLRADGAPALLRILGPAELGPQGGSQAGDHVVHHPDGGEVPPGGVLHAAGGGAGGHPPDHADHAAQALHRSDAAQNQQVDVVVLQPGGQAAQSFQLSAPQGNGGVALPGDGSGRGGGHHQSRDGPALAVHTAGSHQHHPFVVELPGPGNQLLHSLVLGPGHHAQPLSALAGGLLHAGTQLLLHRRVGAVADHQGHVLRPGHLCEGRLVALRSGHGHRRHTGGTVFQSQTDQLRHTLAALISEEGQGLIVAGHGLDRSRLGRGADAHQAHQPALAAAADQAGRVVGGIHPRTLMYGNAHSATPT